MYQKMPENGILTDTCVKLEVSKRKFIHVDTQFITKNRVQIQQLILIL